MKVAIALFEGLTALDAIGPYEVLSRMPGAEVTFVGASQGTVRTDAGNLGLCVDASFETLPAPDIALVPGGPGVQAMVADGPLLEWVRRAHLTSTWTVSVCTGALVLGAAGILRGLDATTHWRYLGELAKYGARASSERVVFEGKVVTAAGVSAGIDMALALAARICGDTMAKAIQLGIEYDPQPPFDSGSLNKASPEVVELVKARARARAARGGTPPPAGTA